MRTASKIAVYFTDAKALEVRTSDIVFASSNICRYGGHLEWSLAQHLILVYELALLYNPEDQLLAAYALLHDAHEIYVGDMVTGLKKLLPEYKVIEINFEEQVHQKYGLSLKDAPAVAVKVLDLKALAIEMKCLSHDSDGAYAPPLPREIKIFEKIHSMSKIEIRKRLTSLFSQLEESCQKQEFQNLTL